MSYLLYCIFGTSARRDLGLPAGIGGQPVLVVAHNGLSAALSELAESDLVPDISQTLAYERVVEHFFREQTVIPLRYGCQLENASEVISLLEDHHGEYQMLLGDLEGLNEMGIRVLLKSSEAGTKTDTSPVPPETFRGTCNSGTAYLAAKRQRFLDLDRAGLDQRLLVDELCGPLSDLFVRRRVESPDLTRSRLLSLYFLVPRASVESFRRAARHLHSKASVKLLLSGPWPPYNFVDSLER
jgi:hypothetical protein